MHARVSFLSNLVILTFLLPDITLATVKSEASIKQEPEPASAPLVHSQTVTLSSIQERLQSGGLPTLLESEMLFERYTKYLMEAPEDIAAYVWDPTAVELAMQQLNFTVVPRPERQYPTPRKRTFFVKIGGGDDDASGASYTLRVVVLQDAVVVSWQATFLHVVQFRRLAAVNEWNSEVGTVAVAYMDHDEDTAGDVVVAMRVQVEPSMTVEAKKSALSSAVALFVIELRVFEKRYLQRWMKEEEEAINSVDDL
eukprot:PhF_6_TR15463/c0_g1_i1/m.24041